MLKKFSAVNESITINRCDNGWVVDVDGEIDNNWTSAYRLPVHWKSVKMICNSEEELFGILKEWNELKLTS